MFSGGSQQKDVKIRVIGDRASGKTTYMAALARFPRSQSGGLVESVVALNEDGENLIAKAKNILEQGLQLEPTALDENAESSRDYQLSIALKKLSTIKEAMRLNVSFKDYAGEFFSDLIFNRSDPLLSSYLLDCAQAGGIMFLMDGSSQRKDSDYASAIEQFFQLLAEQVGASQVKRVALVLTKCELTDLWIKREQPENLTRKRFKLVYEQMQEWQSKSAIREVAFFTSSAFGVMGSPFAEANSRVYQRSKYGVISVLRSPESWNPFGLVAPIYWVCTGDRSRKLDEA